MDGAEQIRPSAWYYLVAAAFFVVGLASMFFLRASGVRQIQNAMVRGEVPGQMDLELRSDLTYTVFLEQASGTAAGSAPTVVLQNGVGCEVHPSPATGVTVATQPAAFANSRFAARLGAPLFEFTAPHKGTYTVECTDARPENAPKLEVAVGGGASKAISAVVARGFLVLIGGVVVGLLIFARVTMLRLASRSEIRERGLKPV